MADFSPLELLDIVLRYLRNPKGLPIKTLDEITNDLNPILNAEQADIYLILNKLIKDEYIKDEWVDVREKNLPLGIEKSVLHYLITFEGKIFLDYPGGYVKQAEEQNAESIRLEKIESDQKASRNQMNVLTAIIAAGTLIAAIYYGVEIYKEFHSFFHRHGLYWIWETIPKKS